MSENTYNILFLSRRGTARSLVAESVINRFAANKFHAYSASVEPASTPEPLAIEILKGSGYETDGLRPRHWRDFTAADAPTFDFVFTLSDTAAGEEIPDWPGGPVTAHWSYPDPVLVEGDHLQQRDAYRKLLAGMERQLKTFIEFPLATLDRMSLLQRVEALGRTEGKATE